MVSQNMKIIIISFFYNMYTHGCTQADGEPVTVFVFNFTGRSENEVSWGLHGILFSVRKFYKFILQTKQAQSAHLRLKTLRHPNILRYIDGIEVMSSV